jgi:tetratricopeptide (TPR) repeat protein
MRCWSRGVALSLLTLTACHGPLRAKTKTTPPQSRPVVPAGPASRSTTRQLTESEARGLLESLNAQGKYEELGQWVERMLREPKLAKGAFKVKLTRVHIRWLSSVAEQRRKAKRYDDCARLYIRIVDTYPKGARTPEVLYNAAICFEAAKRFSSALAARRRLIEGYPKSGLTPRAMVQMAGIYDALGKQGKAAASYELFARRFPGEREAVDSLVRAVALRLGRGEQKLAAADLQTLQKKYGARRRYARRIAAVAFSVGVSYAKNRKHAEVIRHYEALLKTSARRLPAAHRMMALATIGRAYWESACPVKARYGVCRRQHRSGGSCRPRPQLVRRRPARVQKARGYLRRAMAAFQGARRRSRSTAGAYVDHLGGAMDLSAAWTTFYLAEAEHEGLQVLSLPRGRSTRRRRWSQAAKRLVVARGAYLKVFKHRQAEPSLAALLRIAQIQASLARALCEAGDSRAAELHKKVAAIRAECLKRAAALKLDTSSWARGCKGL